jgi:hypothetical protein
VRSAPFLLAGSVLSAMALTGCRAALTPSIAPQAASPQREVRSKSLPPMILVGNYSGDSILGFPLSAKGNVAPSIDIEGTKTGLGHADNVALDPSDRIYVSIDGKTIGAFPANGNGNIRRIRKIQGSNTGLSFPIGVALDSQGYLYVADCGYGDVKVYAPGANGNVSPIRTFSPSNGCTIELGVDANDNVYVTAGDNEIAEFSSASQGNNPVKVIDEQEGKNGVGIRSLAIDDDGNVYAGNLLAKDIRVFAPSASGPSKPIRTIKGRKTHLGAATGLGLDSKKRLYVTVCEHCSQGSGKDSVLVFDAGAKGNVAPLVVIAGSKTKLDAPTDVVIRD